MSEIPPIAAKRTITFHLKPLNKHMMFEIQVLAF